MSHPSNFFHWVLVPQLTSPGLRVLKLGFIHLDDLKMGKLDGAFTGAGSDQPHQYSINLKPIVTQLWTNHNQVTKVPPL
jgi:hypothetical protein